MIALLRFALASAALVALASRGCASRRPTVGDRELAMRSLADMQAANDSIVRTEDGSGVGRQYYYRAAALRARNALIGKSDRDYVAKVGNPGDEVGAIGYIDRLLGPLRTRKRGRDGLRGAKVNLLAAAQSLTDAMSAKQMEDYETGLTAALADVSLAIGRPSQPGVLGGLEGAMATTSLGIPSGTKVVSGCTVTNDAPAYGVTGRTNSTYLSVDRHAASSGDHGGRSPSSASIVVGDRLVLYANTANESARLCAAQAHRSRERRVTRTIAARAPARRERTRAVASSSAMLVSYTSAQAKAGAGVYAANCVSCHGANLQGIAGPAVAGNEFIKQVTGNGWSVGDLRDLVVQQMPLSNPGSLNAKQYARRSSRTYSRRVATRPAVSRSRPNENDKSLTKIKIKAPHGAKPQRRSPRHLSV